MLKNIFHMYVRYKACGLAAQAISGWNTDDGICPRMWSLTVFFEQYIHEGAIGTMEDFGPKEPVDLRDVNNAAG